MAIKLTIRRPDDWHLHVRDGAMLNAVIGESARHFGRAIIMPNLVPPVTTMLDALAYKERITNALKNTGYQGSFTPLMTLYLTDTTDKSDVIEAAASGIVRAVKLYPAGATTNSSSGVTAIDHVMPVLEAMAEHGIILCVHGEVTTSDVDIFDREARFIDTVLQPLRDRLPTLRVVLEHVTTADGVDFILSQPENQAGTITPHHLMINRNHMLVGGIKPHYYCLPVVKRKNHQEALIAAATSGDHRFFLGTDSAPHTTNTKENACGCAGVFNATNTMSCLAEVFEQASALDKLEAFASINGPSFYGLEPNAGTITLLKQKDPVNYPSSIPVNDAEDVTVFDPGRPLFWQVQ